MAKNDVVEKVCRIVEVFHRFGHDSQFVELCADFTKMYIKLGELAQCNDFNEIKRLAAAEMKRVDKKYGLQYLAKRYG